MKRIRSISVSTFLFLLLAQASFGQKRGANGLPVEAIAVTVGGYAMTAKINGKECRAAYMMPAVKTEQIVGFYKGDLYIGLPFNKNDMVAGKKLQFSNQPADLTTDDAVRVWSGHKGEMEITKVNGRWAEGKFFFTGYSYDGNKKSINVTDGFFRIALDK